MRHLILVVLLAALSSSCVATRGDLTDMSAGFADAFAKFEQRADDAPTQADIGLARAELLAELKGTVDKTVDAIDGRIADVVATVDTVSEKVGEGPMGWLELLLGAAGTTVAGVGGLHVHRNSTRRRDLEVQELRKAAGQ